MENLNSIGFSGAAQEVLGVVTSITANSRPTARKTFFISIPLVRIMVQRQCKVE